MPSSSIEDTASSIPTHQVASFVKIETSDPYRLFFQLSSGRCLGLTDERATDRLITSNESHRSLRARFSLYELMEWIEYSPYENPDHQFRFAGFHFGQTHLLSNEYTESERSDLKKLLALPTSLQFQARVRKLFDEQSHTEIEFLSNSIKWTFPLKEYLVRDLTRQRQRLKADQWSARLDKLTGIKKDELRWSGVEYFLQNSNKDTRLSTESIIDALDYCRIQPILYRQVRTEAQMRPFDFKWVNKPATKKHMKLMRGFTGDVEVYLQHRVYGYEILRVRPNDLLKGPTHWLVVTNQKLIAATLQESFFDSFEEAITAAKSHMQKAIRSRALLQSHNEYQKFTAYEELHYYSNWLLVLPHYPAHLCQHSHFRLRNVWLHLRTSIEVCAKTGIKCLIIHELQSDLLQHRAYNNSYIDDNNNELVVPETLPWASHWYETGINLALSIAVQHECDGIALMSGYYHNMTYGLPGNDPGLIKFYDQICIKVIKKIAAEWGSVLETGEFNHTEANYHLVHFKQGYLWLNKHGEPIQEFNTIEQAMTVMHKEEQLDTVKIAMMSLTHDLKTHIKHTGIPLMGIVKRLITINEAI